MAGTTISTDDVRYVAKLAKIAVSDEEAERLRHELDAILGYVRQLESLDTVGVEPTYQVSGLRNVDRADELIDYGISRQDLLANAPHTQDGYIRVPKVL